MEETKSFLTFAQPFIKALKETFSVMMQNEIKIHSPKIKSSIQSQGDITATIGMNGIFEKEEKQIKFKGMLAITWKENVYLKMASGMLFQEYTEYCDDVSDAGAEIINIVMGNAKKELAPLGYKIEMATPSTIRGPNHEIRYPPKTTVVESIVTSTFGDFIFEICYQESIL